MIDYIVKIYDFLRQVKNYYEYFYEILIHFTQMPDNQKKKISPEQKKQREEINIFIEKVTGRQISDVISEYFPTNKGTYYDNVVKIPLSLKFIDLMQSKVGVNLSVFSRPGKEARFTGENKEVETKKDDMSYEYLQNEVIRLHEKIEAILTNATKDKDKIIELQEQINNLNIQLARRQG